MFWLDKRREFGQRFSVILPNVYPCSGSPGHLPPFLDKQQPAESERAPVRRLSRGQAKVSLTFFMRIAILMLASLLGTCAFAAKVGDSYDQVIAEKGKPSGQIAAGNARVLNYADVSIRLRDDVVVEIKSIEAVRGPATRTDPAMTAKGAGQPDVANAGLEWITSYRSALARARKEGRSLFLYFTGSDRPDLCKRLDEEILSTAEFKSYAKEKLILVKLDLLKQTEQSGRLRNQSMTLAEQYGVTDYPTVIILDRTGRPVKTLGYQEGGPGPFVAALRSVER
jgi:protein disulfide-isomerase